MTEGVPEVTAMSLPRVSLARGGPGQRDGHPGRKAKGRQADKEPEGLSLTCRVVLGNYFSSLRDRLPMCETGRLHETALKAYRGAGSQHQLMLLVIPTAE